MKTNYLYKRILISLLAGAMLLLSCTKVIDLKLKDADAALVIEGNVTNSGNNQTVKISKSVAITATNNSPAVSGANVTITRSNDGRVFQLTEQKPGTYTTNTLRGQSGITYQLNVVVNGKTYTSTSTMPNAVKLDSVSLDVTSILNKDYLNPEVFYKDPAGVANYYRYLMFVNDVQVKNIFAYNDDLTDGRAVQRLLRDNDVDLKKGDRINIEMQCTDKNIYTYWNGLNQNENRGGASTTPANPQSNISGGVLGYFSAHTVQQSYFVIP